VYWPTCVVSYDDISLWKYDNNNNNNNKHELNTVQQEAKLSLG